MATRRQGSIYQRISDLEATVEKLERRLTRKQAIKHEPVAFLCKTATTFAAKSGGGALGKGEIWIYEVDKTDVQFDTAEKKIAYNYASGGTNNIASNVEAIALRVGRTQRYVIIWVLCT